MTTFQAQPLSTPRPRTYVARRVSPLLGALAVALLVGGAVVGAIIDGPGRTVAHVVGTAAWPEHLVITAALLTFLAGVVVTRGRVALLAPLSRRTAIRLRAAWSIHRARLAVVVPLVLLLGYLVFRIGLQITAGLDPNFTANAWGGPSYVGALWCHLVDAIAIGTLAVGGLHLALPRAR